VYHVDVGDLIVEPEKAPCLSRMMNTTDVVVPLRTACLICSVKAPCRLAYSSRSSLEFDTVM
jgi:hypothetical protein